MSSKQPPPNGDRAALMRDRNFVWLMAGGIISMLVDQFTLVALPWLVLRMTGDTLVLGTVLALMSLPRALFILIGGAVVDRYSPRKVLMITKYVNTVLLAALAVLVLAGGLTLWTVYALAFAIGLATAFSIPSATSMLPHVMRPAQLPAANGAMMGLRQVSMFLGPLLAGLLIVLFGDGPHGGTTGSTMSGAVTDATGLAVAFGFDALSFLASAWTLSKVRQHNPAQAGAAAPVPTHQPVFAAVAAGLRHLWNDRDLRLCFIYWGGVAVLLTVLVRSFLFQAYSIPSPSMAPTLAIGDRVLVAQLNTDPARGDIIVFDRPANDPKTSPDDPDVLIKRVIGMPGETIESRDGVVYVDGKKLTEDYLPEGTETVITSPKTVPEGTLLVLGDNRSESYDGRYFGPIDKDLIVGRAIARIWPLSRAGGL